MAGVEDTYLGHQLQNDKTQGNGTSQKDTESERRRELKGSKGKKGRKREGKKKEPAKIVGRRHKRDKWDCQVPY